MTSERSAAFPLAMQVGTTGGPAAPLKWPRLPGRAEGGARVQRPLVCKTRRCTAWVTGMG